jgi:hypothetical protein
VGGEQFAADAEAGGGKLECCAEVEVSGDGEAVGEGGESEGAGEVGIADDAQGAIDNGNGAGRVEWGLEGAEAAEGAAGENFAGGADDFRAVVELEGGTGIDGDFAGAGEGVGWGIAVGEGALFDGDAGADGAGAC